MHLTGEIIGTYKRRDEVIDMWSDNITDYIFDDSNNITVDDFIDWVTKDSNNTQTIPTIDDFMKFDPNDPDNPNPNDDYPLNPPTPTNPDDGIPPVATNAPIPKQDPLVLDTDKDGFISTIALEDSNTYFDITGDGIKEKVSWIDANDGILAYDKNGNGKIDGIDELYSRLKIWHDTNYNTPLFQDQ